MRKRLQLALMLTATTAIATSFSLFCDPSRAWAAEGEGKPEMITPTQEHGRKIYVNESAPAEKHASETPLPKRSSKVYWSSKENPWKPVPSAGGGLSPGASASAGRGGPHDRTHT